MIEALYARVFLKWNALADEGSKWGAVQLGKCTIILLQYSADDAGRVSVMGEFVVP